MAKSSPRATMSEEKSDELDEMLGFEGDAKPPAEASPDWAKGVSALSLEKLDTIRADIDKTVEDTIITVARARLKLGKLLQRARDLFPGDNEFGKWRKAVLPDMAPRTVSQYMAMAKEFKDAPALVDKLGWSTARELLNASPEVVKEVKEKAEKGEEVTTAEVKEAKAKDKPAPQPSEHGGTDKKTSKKMESMDDKIDRVLMLFPRQRIEAVLEGEFDGMDEYSQSAIIYGFGPEFIERPCNLDTFLAVHAHLKEKLEGEDDSIRILEQAYTKIKEAWGSIGK